MYFYLQFQYKKKKITPFTKKLGQNTEGVSFCLLRKKYWTVHYT
jgi:hypothetical protein